MKAQLREMLLKMVAYAESGYTVTNEVAIYEKLLGFEDKRLMAFAERVMICFLECSEVMIVFRF